MEKHLVLGRKSFRSAARHCLDLLCFINSHLHWRRPTQHIFQAGMTQSQGWGSTNGLRAAIILQVEAVSLPVFPISEEAMGSASQPYPSHCSTSSLENSQRFWSPIKAEDTSQGNSCICQQNSVCTLKTSNKNRIYTVWGFFFYINNYIFSLVEFHYTPHPPILFILIHLSSRCLN